MKEASCKKLYQKLSLILKRHHELTFQTASCQLAVFKNF